MDSSIILISVLDDYQNYFKCDTSLKFWLYLEYSQVLVVGLDHYILESCFHFDKIIVKISGINI